MGRGRAALRAPFPAQGGQGLGRGPGSISARGGQGLGRGPGWSRCAVLRFLYICVSRCFARFGIEIDGSIMFFRVKENKLIIPLIVIGSELLVFVLVAQL